MYSSAPETKRLGTKMKPRAVYYNVSNLRIGHSALVLRGPHHILPDRSEPVWAFTSPVVKITDDGFETEHTQWVKEEYVPTNDV